MMTDSIYPFELCIQNKEQKELFIDTVEQVLKENLQCEDSFGCMINNCHTHVGSKKHFASFVEAELLFHNSYYNKGFAFLTVEFLRNEIAKWEKVVLVGYETFSELYLCETAELMRQKLHIEVEYCVVETIGGSLKPRMTNKNFFDEETFCVFIVPINTTLTTHDKLMNAFEEYIGFNVNNSANIALIMIAPNENNDYWTRISGERFDIKLEETKQKLLKNLGERWIHYFAWINMDWKDASQCDNCYPDLDEKSLIEEKPIFEVNRASIVPMLQLGIQTIPEPLHDCVKECEEKNIKKVVLLSQYLCHRHVERNGNHFQYYFDTQAFFEAAKIAQELSLPEWLDDVKEQIDKRNREDKNCIVYNFLVAPRHHTNAGMVKLVNDVVFHGSARILYFDVSREYRDNIKAKYSDFSRLIDNIINSKQKSHIQFHFVDDMIFSGNSFLRTKSLMRSLINVSENEEKSICKITLFSSIIILVGRNSGGTKQGYIEDTNRFFEYVHLSISPMRNHEDACTLCQLVECYQQLETISATNQMAQLCRNTVDNHKVDSVENSEDVEKRKKELTEEKKLRVILRHLFSERLKNRWWMDNKCDCEVVKKEDQKSIYDFLNRFYLNGLKELERFGDFEILDVQIAFIKIITRPFFTYHIRRKQAAFQFCLEKLDAFLEKKMKELSNSNNFVLNAADSKIFLALINGLADMNAVYLIRATVMEKILKIISPSGGVISKLDYYKAVKKMLGLSMDDNKGILMEYILVQQNESGFFGNDKNKSISLEKKDRLALYLENNQILVSGFSDLCLKTDLSFSQGLPYYLEKFVRIFDINGFSTNTTDKRDTLCKNYLGLKQELTKNDSLKKIGKLICQFFDNIEVQVFLQDDSQEILWDKYILLNGTKKDQENTACRTFYCKDNLHKIEKAFENEIILETIYGNNKDDFCILQIGDNKTGAIFLKIPWIFSDKEEDSFEGKLDILFKIKILLTLRKEFVKMLIKSHLPNVKRQLYIEKIRKALVIKKAGKHYTTEYYESLSMALDMRKRYDNNKKEGSEKEGSEEESYYKELLDKYYLLLSNEFVTSFYRDVVHKKSEDLSINETRLERRFKKNLHKMGFKDDDKNSGLSYYDIMVPNHQDCVQKVHIECDTSSFEDKKFRFLSIGRERIPFYYLIILTMIANAGYHFRGSQESKCNMSIRAEENYMIFSNTLLDPGETLGDDSKAQIENKAKEKMNCPPWEYEEKDQSITLWAFAQYFERVQSLKPDEGADKNEREEVVIEVDDNKFTIKLPLLTNVQNNQCGKGDEKDGNK